MFIVHWPNAQSVQLKFTNVAVGLLLNSDVSELELDVNSYPSVLISARLYLNPIST